MDQTSLRELQRPIKDAYREAPASALVTLHAAGVVDGEAITCTVPTWSGPARAGLHPSAGGDGSDACSGDLLLQAVAGCAGVTLRSVATAMGIVLRGAHVHVTGTFDARGTLGVERGVAVGLTDVDVRFELDTDADPSAVERLLNLTERSCVVAQTLTTPPRLRVRRA